MFHVLLPVACFSHHRPHEDVEKCPRRRLRSVAGPSPAALRAVSASASSSSSRGSASAKSCSPGVSSRPRPCMLRPSPARPSHSTADAVWRRAAATASSSASGVAGATESAAANARWYRSPMALTSCRSRTPLSRVGGARPLGTAPPTAAPTRGSRNTLGRAGTSSTPKPGPSPAHRMSGLLLVLPARKPLAYMSMCVLMSEAKCASGPPSPRNSSTSDAQSSASFTAPST
eukprot:323697-Chlamydomonas_euryale.AAC.2